MNNAVTAALSQAATPEANRDALQAALDTGAPVFVPPGVFPLAPGAQARGAGQAVFGQGPHRTILDCRGAGPFLSDGEWWGFRVAELQMIGKLGGQVVTGGPAILMDGSVGSNAAPWQMINGQVQNVLLDGMWHGVLVRDQNNVRIEGLRMAAMQGDGVIVEGLNANLRTDAVTLRDLIYEPTPEAVAAGRGTGIVIDGAVQTIDIQGANLVRPLRGVDVRNTAGLPLGQHAAFLHADSLKVDFPLSEAVSVAAIDGLRMVNSYFHGSRGGSGIMLGGGARDITLAGCKVTSHAGNGIVMAGAELDIWGCRIDDNALGIPAASGLAVVSAARVSVTGGSLSNPAGAYGINRANAGAAVTLAGGPRLAGRLGPRNF